MTEMEMAESIRTDQQRSQYTTEPYGKGALEQSARHKQESERKFDQKVRELSSSIERLKRSYFVEGKKSSEGRSSNQNIQRSNQQLKTILDADLKSSSKVDSQQDKHFRTFGKTTSPQLRKNQVQPGQTYDFSAIERQGVGGQFYQSRSNQTIRNQTEVMNFNQIMKHDGNQSHVRTNTSDIRQTEQTKKLMADYKPQRQNSTTYPHSNETPYQLEAQALHDNGRRRKNKVSMPPLPFSQDQSEISRVQ